MNFSINHIILLINELPTLPSLIKQLIISSTILIAFVVLGNIFTKYFFVAILKLCSKTKTDLDEKIFLAFKSSLKVFFVICGLYLAIIWLPIDSSYQLIINRSFRSVIIILVTWGLYNLEDINTTFFDKIQQTLDIELDKILIPFVSKFLRIITLIFAFTIILQEWNYPIGSLIAGLGLGGLAFALAAKDALSNIFGGIVIILDKPFSIGDWIKTSSIEGVVEDITFRSTRIRTFAKALVTVPNSTLANDSITNWSRMGKRRITFNLGVAYSTPVDKLKTLTEKIRKMLYNHPGIDKETIFVRFDSFNESSLDIFLYFFTVSTNWSEFLQVKEDINFKILELVEQDDITIAFPSRSLYIETPISISSK